MESTDLDLVLETIRKEHRRTQLVFGVCIIIVAIVLAVTGSLAIRTSIDEQPTLGTSGDVEQGVQDDAATQAVPVASTTGHD